MDFSAFKYNKDNIPQEHNKQEKFFLELEEIFSAEIKTSPVASDFFKNYDPKSLDHFIDIYVRRKAHLAKLYDYYINIKPRRDLRFRNKAEVAFDAIKQKKLFNLQLKWRAESISIPEINFSYDFVFWSKFMDACNFLPPVTAEEVEIMKEYLKNEDAFRELGYYSHEWQDYDEFMNKDGDDPQENMPDWYEYYDIRMGTGSLLILPDIRGKKEEYYVSLGRKDYHKKIDDERILNPSPPYVPPPPSLYSDEKNIREFVKAFETDKHFIKLFEIYLEEHERSDETEYEDSRVEEAIDLLEEANIPVMMPGGLEWREAIIRCAQIYESEMISAELDALYEEHRMLNELGIYSGISNEELKTEYDKETIVQILRGFLLKGRELSGEPADFNF